jgi:hypothetical protein
MATVFSELLVKFRSDAGFKTAYSFFHDNGGQPVLGLSYRKYLMLEQGKNLPALARLNRLSYALRLVPGSVNANSLTVAWLRSFAGEQVYKEVLAPVIAPRAEAKGVSPLHKAIEKSITDKKYFLTPAQYEVIMSSFETYLCYQALSNEIGSWPADALARTLGLDRAKAAAALKKLASVKVVKEIRKGVFKSPLADMTVESPQLNIARQDLMEKHGEYNSRLKATGVNEWYSTCLMRADREAIRGFLPLMNLNIHTAGTYSTNRRSDRTALYFIEGRVTRLRDF